MYIHFKEKVYLKVKNIPEDVWMSSSPPCWVMALIQFASKKLIYILKKKQNSSLHVLKERMKKNSIAIEVSNKYLSHATI